MSCGHCVPVFQEGGANEVVILPFEALYDPMLLANEVAGVFLSIKKTCFRCAYKSQALQIVPRS